MNTYQICMLFVSDSKLNIILKSDIKKERKFKFLFIIFSFKISGILSDRIWDLVGSTASALIYYSKFDKGQAFIFVCRRSCLFDTKNVMIDM